MNQKNISVMRFGGVLFSDIIKKQPSGKVDLMGVFTIFNSWAFPCVRFWNMTLTIYDSREGGTILVGIRKKGKTNLKNLASIKFNERKEDERSDRIITAPISNEFKSDGDYEIVCKIEDKDIYTINPLGVRLLKWPEFTEKDIEFAKNNANKIVSKINVQVHCPKCGYIYVFEESIVGEGTITSGANKFPVDGEFKCNDCDHTFNIKDLQGQLRYNIKENLKRFNQ